MRHLLFSLCLFGFARLCCADIGDPELIRLLKAQAERWDRAIVNKDVPGILENVSAQFRHIDGEGHLSSREEFLAELVSPDLKIDPYTVEDFDVRIYGNVAVLCGRTRMTGQYQGSPFNSHYRYVDLYHFEDGHWRVVNIQITRIPKEDRVN